MYKLSLDECERQYKIFTSEIFKQNLASGVSNLLTSQSYYDTKLWEKMLRESLGDTLVINSARDRQCPRIALITNLVTENQMKLYLFRNYNLPTWSKSHYEGTSKYKVWEAIRASSAAPGYYQDFVLDGQLFYVSFIYLFKI